MKNLQTRKTSNGSSFGWLIRQMSINQKSGRKTFRRRFESGSIFDSPCPPGCYFQSETKIEPDLRLPAAGVIFHVQFFICFISNNMIDQISTGPFYFIIFIFVSIIINFVNIGESVVKQRSNCSKLLSAIASTYVSLSFWTLNGLFSNLTFMDKGWNDVAIMITSQSQCSSLPIV